MVVQARGDETLQSRGRSGTAPLESALPIAPRRPKLTPRLFEFGARSDHPAGCRNVKQHATCAQQWQHPRPGLLGGNPSGPCVKRALVMLPPLRQENNKGTRIANRSWSHKLTPPLALAEQTVGDRPPPGPPCSDRMEREARGLLINAAKLQLFLALFFCALVRCLFLMRRRTATSPATLNRQRRRGVVTPQP